jgi:cell division inhibitor SepF
MAGWMQNTGRKLGLLLTDPEDDRYYGQAEPIGGMSPNDPDMGGLHIAPPEAEDMPRIVTAQPRTWDDAKTIGLTFRESVPVIMNVSRVSDADAQRLVDFAAGLVCAMRGHLARITPQVYLLSPPGVDVAEVSANAPE